MTETVGSLFRARARCMPQAPAVQDESRCFSYAQLDERVNRAAHVLAELGLARGDRVVLVSENRIEILELMLAAAKSGIALACPSWRLAAPELASCVELVDPKLLVVSARFHESLAPLAPSSRRLLRLDADYEERLDASSPREPRVEVAPEDALLILYTSGTSGRPKGAVLSHRAELARARVLESEYELSLGDTYLAWSPLFHMVAADKSLAALIGGGKVIVADGFDAARLVEILAREEIGWLSLMPGTIEPLIEELERSGLRPRGVKQCGAMADLVPAQQIARITRLLDAPFVNSFGSTETGLPPASSGLIPIGVAPSDLAKKPTGACEIRLVDEQERDLPDGRPGELLIRGPTLFSGYWNDEQATAEAFRGGWFHTGDLLARRPDGTLDFVDRVNAMIKSGGENVYPAEIERVLCSDPRVAAAVVVRAADTRWGEVPVAVVVRKDSALSTSDLQARCRSELAGFKQPRAIHFVAAGDLPRNATGKILRGAVEARIARGELPRG